MSYQLPVTLSLALLLSACTNITPLPKKVTTVKEKEVIKAETMVKDTNLKNRTKQTIKTPLIVENITDNRDIQGNYILERGQISFGDIRKNINSSDLVIEKLDDDNFGFYYTVQVEEHAPDEYFGIFYYKDDKFVQKVITDDGDVSYYDNIELIKEDNRLKLTIKTNQGKRIIIWDKIEDITPSSELLNAKKSYTGVCKAKYNDLMFN
jgi:hypothetical protein